MPVSRNRNKKNKKHINRLPTLADLSRMIGLDNCRKCNSLRDEFYFDELPDKEQAHWHKSGILNSIDYFLYCANCEEYSAILELDEL